MAHPDNRFYGHDRALADYVGRSGRPAVIGHVQHGWAQESPFPEPDRLVPFLPIFAWSERDVRTLRDQGVTDVTAIGAPFLYLRAMLESALDDWPRPRSTLFYPHHGHGRLDLGAADDILIDEIRARESGPVTVALYWHEFDTPAIRGCYERAGFRVTCHGDRDDPRFLWRQFAEILVHDRVATNRLGTALWYGASLGSEVEVYGTPSGWDDQEVAHAVDLRERHWPELGHGPVPGREARPLADVELGAASLRSPAELRSLLGWDVGAGTAAVTRVRARLAHEWRRAAHHLRAVRTHEGRRYLRRALHLD